MGIGPDDLNRLCPPAGVDTTDSVIAGFRTQDDKFANPQLMPLDARRAGQKRRLSAASRAPTLACGFAFR
jgi:hypothetical protein